MNYKALISTIIFLGLIAVILVLLQERTMLNQQIQEQNDSDAIEVVVQEPTELVETNARSFYEGETLERATPRCEYGDCLFTGGGGLIGMTTVEGSIVAIEQETMEGNPATCDALYVKRGPSELLEDQKIARFFDEEAQTLTIPFNRESVTTEEVWIKMQEAEEGAPGEFTIFFADSAERGLGTCESSLQILDVQ